MNATIEAGALRVLTTVSGQDKATLTRELVASWGAGDLVVGQGGVAMPGRPARPARPALLAPREMPRRCGTGLAGRTALIHALAHIELNAIDLAWDLIGRFGREDWPKQFYDDWVGVASDEARHFTLLDARLRSLGATYGDLPAHDGLWEAADNTAHDALARLAVVPLVLEARALDVTPGMISRLNRAGDNESADLIETIGREEIGHVAAGWRWFKHLAERRGLNPASAYRENVRKHFAGNLKPPFNHEARRMAGLEPELYEVLSA